jgi:dolichyl-phosphate beta-glucosyltransferase
MKAPIGSIVVPCYNEEARINPKYFDSLSKKLNTLGFEIIFVNDGSTDGTLARIQEFESKFRIYNLETNQGKAEAIRKAMLGELQNSSKRIIGYLDSDGAFSTEDIEHLTKKFILDPEFQEYQVLSAARVKLAGKKIERKAVRHFIGRIISTFLNIGNETKIYDPQSGFKLFRISETLKTALNEPFTTRWFVDLEILSFYASQKNYIVEEPISTWRDISGSKIQIIEYPQILIDLVKIKYKIRKQNL